MALKRLTIVIVALALLAPMAANVSASGNGASLTAAGARYLANSSVVQEATGLDATELLNALQDGSSVTQLIEANEADVDEAIASLVEEATAEINVSKDAAISRLPEAISQQLDRNWHWRFKGLSPVFVSIFRQANLSQATSGSDNTDRQETPAAGASLLALVEANGGDVEGLVADLVEEATMQINTFATVQIDALEDVFREQFSATYSDRRSRRWPFRWPRLPLPNTPNTP